MVTKTRPRKTSAPSIHVPVPAEELPPLPEPGQPADEVLAALVAWSGGVFDAIGALAQSVAADLAFRCDDRVTDEQFDQVRRQLETLEGWALQNDERQELLEGFKERVSTLIVARN
jgi:hypothetical protein